MLIFMSNAQEKAIHIIPKPVALKMGKGHFKLTKDTKLISPTGLIQEVGFFKDALVPSTGFHLEIVADEKKQKGTKIVFKFDEKLKKKFGKEAYSIKVAKTKIEVSVASASGAFNSIQSLLQLLPTEVFSKVKISNVNWNIPSVEIVDYPRFAWRGFMLDASRSFQPISYVKKTLDLMAMHKMNVFHWHLTDDHGWRVEIKKYPVLTEKGAWRLQPNFPEFGKTEMYGGYYTQEEIRDIIKYATERNITIIPEVDLPGHSSTLVYSMPEMACENAIHGDGIHKFDDFPKRQKPYVKNIGTNVICPGTETTFEIAENILKEIMDLFPTKYVHIGGDEVNKKWWKACSKCKHRMEEEHLEDYDQLQAYFIKRLEKIVNKHGKKLIGWDEILEGGLSKTATVMGWRGLSGALKSVKEGREVIIASNKGYYIQKGQTENLLHPQRWPGFTTAENMYNYKAIPTDFTEKEKKLILGVQSSLWTPFMSKPEVWDIAIFPRNCAMSEVAWTPLDKKNWNNYQTRLKTHLKRLAYKGVSYWREKEEVINNFELKNQKEVVLTYDVSKKITTPGSYFVTIDYLEGGNEGLELLEAIVLKDGKQIVSDTHLGFTTAKKDHDRIYFMNLQSTEEDSKYTLKVRLKNLSKSGVKGVVYISQP